MKTPRFAVISGMDRDRDRLAIVALAALALPASFAGIFMLLNGVWDFGAGITLCGLSSAFAAFDGWRKFRKAYPSNESN